MAAVQDILEPSGTETSKAIKDSEESGKSPRNGEILEPSDQDTMGLSRTETPKSVIDSAEDKGSTETMDSQESSGMATGPDMEGLSRAEITKALIESEESIDSEKSGGSAGQTEIPGTDQDTEGLSVTEIFEKSATTQRDPDKETTETTGDTLSAERQMEEAPVPLNRNDNPANDPENAETAIPENREDECDAGRRDDNEEFEILEYSASNFDTKENFQKKIDQIKEIMKSTCPMYWILCKDYHTVGIFSRSSESDFKWLIDVLKSQAFQSVVSTARPFYISNNGRPQFMEDVSQCTFGILYHTKNRGRINIVDVTDSLYDEELKYMSECLGKNVIVVVDDLEDTSYKMKSNILNEQPSITKLAQDIFLFSTAEKKAMNIGEVPEES